MKRHTHLILLLALAGTQLALPQTTISLRTQSTDVDFTNATSTKPFKTGTTLPTACGLGDSFLKTNAAAGQNIYVCTVAGNPGTWTVEGGGAGGSGASDMSALTDFAVSHNATSATVGCPSGQCQVRIGEKVYVFTSNSTAQSLTGAGAAATVFFYINASGAMNFGYDGVAVTGATLSGMTGIIGVSNYPANVMPLSHCTVSGNQFTTCFDDRAIMSRTVVDQGTGMIVIQNPLNGHTTVSVNPATVPLLGSTNTYSGALNDFSATQIRVTTGAGAPSGATCNSAAAVGYLYIRSDAGATNSSVYACVKTGANVWAWELVQYNSSSLPSGVALTASANTFTSGTQDFSAVQLRATTGTGVPSAANCAAAANVGYLYIRNDAAAANASVYSCDLTAPDTYAWELIQSAGSSAGGGGGGGSTGGGLAISGPYLTDGTSYWISGTGQPATLFSNAGFSFRQAHATYSAQNHVGYVTLPAGSTATDNFEVVLPRSTIIATLNINAPSNTGGANGSAGIALRNAGTGVECGVATFGVSQPTGIRPYMNKLDSAYNYQDNVTATGSSIASPIVTLKITYAAPITTCYFSTDGGFTYTTIGSQNGSATGYLNSAPTAAALNVSAGGYGASVGILSWVTQ